MRGDGSYTGSYTSLRESPSYISLLEHSLSTREISSACISTCLSSADPGGCSVTNSTCLSTNQVFIDSFKACIEGGCSVSPNDGYGIPGDAAAASIILQALSASLIGSTTTAGASSPAAKSFTSSSSIPASSSSIPASSSSIPASSSSTPASSSGGSGTLTTSAISSSISSNSANGRSMVMIGPIIGGVIGFLVLAVLVVGLIWFCKSRQKRGVRIRRFASDSSLTSAEYPLVLPSFTVEPFRIPSAARQNSGRLPASPSMKQVEATSLISTTTQTPSSMQMPSSSAGTPIGGLMMGSGSRVVLHEDSGIRMPRQGGEVVEMPPLYSRGQAKPTNKNGNFLMATKYPENVQIG